MEPFRAPFAHASSLETDPKIGIKQTTYLTYLPISHQKQHTSTLALSIHTESSLVSGTTTPPPQKNLQSTDHI